MYLDSDACYAEMQRFAGEQGLSLGISERTLHKQLDTNGMLAGTEKDQARKTYTVRRMIRGRRLAVLKMFAEVIATTDDLTNLTTARYQKQRK